MRIGILEIRLHLPGVRSLKEKRSIVKPLLLALRRKFNVSAAEIAGQDQWQVCILAAAAVAANSAQAHSIMENIGAWLDEYPGILPVHTDLDII